jgi:hypothetical protein
MRVRAVVEFDIPQRETGKRYSMAVNDRLEVWTSPTPQNASDLIKLCLEDEMTGICDRHSVTVSNVTVTVTASMIDLTSPPVE